MYAEFRTISVSRFLIFGLCSSLWAEVRNLHIEMYPRVVQTYQEQEAQAVNVVPSGKVLLEFPQR